MGALLLERTTTLWPWFFPLLAIVLGGVFGSFLTCALYRCPRGESLWYPPSRCPQCDARLKVADLIPIVSFLVFKGRCRHCGAFVGAWYILVEIWSVVLALASLAVGGVKLGTLGLYGGLMAASFVLIVLWQGGHFSTKSVAFGLLCFGLYWANIGG